MLGLRLSSHWERFQFLPKSQCLKPASSATTPARHHTSCSPARFIRTACPHEAASRGDVPLRSEPLAADRRGVRGWITPTAAAPERHLEGAPPRAKPASEPTLRSVVFGPAASPSAGTALASAHAEGRRPKPEYRERRRRLRTLSRLPPEQGPGRPLQRVTPRARARQPTTEPAGWRAAPRTQRPRRGGAAHEPSVLCWLAAIAGERRIGGPRAATAAAAAALAPRTASHSAAAAAPRRDGRR